MTDKQGRELLKGPIEAAPARSASSSYTQPIASKREVIIGRAPDTAIKGVEFSSRDVPQPFLDPSILEKRAEAERRWHLSQEKQSSVNREIGKRVDHNLAS